MAFSWQESVKPAGTQNIQCDIEYLDKSYIHVYLDGAETTAFTWTSPTNIRLNSPLAAETAVLLIRKTEREYLYIEFASGAPFIEVNVDTQNTQFLHLAQELVEGRYIEGFYGDINMHRYRITNLGDPVDARDAANKQYVDAGDTRLDQRIDAEHAAWVTAVDNEASIRKAADDALDVRTTNLEQTYFNANTNSFPWWTVLSADTDTVVPGVPFTKAKVRLNGVTQTAGYSYTVNSGTIKFAKVIPAGTLVDVTIGIDTDADTSAVSTILGLLSSADGSKYIGQCPDFTNLRLLEPSYAGQSVIVKRRATGMPTVDARFTYDATDTTTDDDDVAVIVTAGGKRWKADLSEGYDLRLAGVGVDGSNFSAALNKVVSVIIRRAVQQGRVNNVTRAIRVVPTNFICEFKLDAPIDLPSFVSLGFIGSPYLEARDLVGSYAFRVANCAFPTLTKAMMAAETSWSGGPLNQVIGNKCITALDGGRITLRGPGFPDTSVEKFGVILGNDVATELDVRDCSVEDMNIFGFQTSHILGGYYSFMIGFRNCNFSRCYRGMKLPKIFGNAGERLWYESCTFGNITSHAFQLYGAGTYTLVNVSTDFIGGDLFHFGPESPASIEFLSGHIEGIQGQDGAKDAPTNYSQARVHVHSAVLRDPRQGGGTYRGIRQRWGCPASAFGQGLSVIDESISPGMENTKPATEYPCYTGYPGNTGVFIETPRTANRGTPWLNSYSAACSKRINSTISFTSSVGEVGSNLLSTDYAFAYEKTGGALIEYGTAADASADGYLPFKITLSDPSDVATLFCTNRAQAPTGLRPLWAAASVKLAESVGNAMLIPVMACYMGAAVTSVYNDTNKTVTSTFAPIRRGTTTGNPLDLRALLTGSGLTTSQFQATYPRSVAGWWQGCDFFVPGFRFTGFTGTIYLKLPVWWFEGSNFGG